MTLFPLPAQDVEALAKKFGIDLNRASIREVNRLVNQLEHLHDIRFVRMEFGIPGLPAGAVAADAISEYLHQNPQANAYAPFDGMAALKETGATFFHAFWNLSWPSRLIVPTNGGMHGCLLAMAIAGSLHQDRPGILGLNPGFPVNRAQAQFLGLPWFNLEFDRDHQGLFPEKLDRFLGEHPIGGVIWSSPNNPSWLCLSDEELQQFAAIFKKHGVVAIEDAAYFGMDFRTDVSQPFKPPYPPSIGHHYARSFLVWSSSKLYSFAGQRIGLLGIHPDFAEQEFPPLQHRMGKTRVLDAVVHGGIYPTTASISSSAQVGLQALLQATLDGTFSPWNDVRAYENRAKTMKTLFLENGFQLIFQQDGQGSLADGFYFTVSFPGMTGAELVRHLLFFGLSAISLDTTGLVSAEGIRICVSLVADHQMEDLRARLQAFQRVHGS